MDIKQLKYFLAIAEEGQITGAAKRLHIAQPPLSQQLKLLEDELGVKLVERGSRKIELTDAGRLLRNKAEQILELTDATVKELKDFSRGMQGTLSIGTVSSSGATLLPDRISNFHRKYPGINFEVWEANTYRILEILSSGIIEIGIVRTPFNIDSFNSIRLSTEPMVAVSKGGIYWSRDEKSISLACLMNKPLIIYRRFEKLILQVCQNAGFEPLILCKNDDARTTLMWAESGMGIGIVPRSAVKLTHSSSLNYLEIEEPSLQTRIAVIWVKNHYLSNAARHFLEFFGSDEES